MDLGLAGKRALVLGGSKGLGFGIANALAQEGARVMVASRSGDACEAAAAKLAEEHGVEAHGQACDLGDTQAIDRLTQAALDTLGGVDVLINNSGGPPGGPISAVSQDTWEAQFRAMVLSLMRVTERLLPGMRERGWGRIILVASSGVRQPIPELGISNTLRVALANWGKTLSFEVAGDGVTVNTLLPGRITTDRTHQLDTARAEREGKSFDDVRTASAKLIPLGRYGTVEEFGAAAAFLASEQASYITGALVPVDGGLIKSL